MTRHVGASHLAAIAVALTLAVAAPAGSATSAPDSLPDSAAADSGVAPSTRFDVSDLPTGLPPAIAWSERSAGTTVIHGSAGTVTPAPQRLTSFAPMGSGYVIQTIGKKVITRWTAVDGSPGKRSWRTGYGIGVSAKGKAVAFSGKRGKVWSIDQEGDRVLSFNPVPIKQRGQAVTVFGEDCSERTSNFGCTIFVNGPRGYYTSSHGLVDRAPRMRLVSTGRGRYLGGITKISDTGTCSLMLRRTRVGWRTCANRFSDIATDNDHVLGLPAYGDGFGPTTLDVLATDNGDVVRAFTASRRGNSATYFDEVWEDADHVLVVTFQEDEWAIVRLGVDGSMEYAVPPRAGSTNMRTPLHLQTR